MTTLVKSKEIIKIIIIKMFRAAMLTGAPSVTSLSLATAS